MIEIIQIAFGIVFLCFMAYGCWISSVMLSERSILRKYTGEYYDFDIDEKLKVMGTTRQEVLRKDSQ